MAKRYCKNCGDVLPVGQTYCMTCGFVNDAPVKKKIENTEPVSYINEIDEPVSLQTDELSIPGFITAPVKQVNDFPAEAFMPELPEEPDEVPAEEVPAEEPAAEETPAVEFPEEPETAEETSVPEFPAEEPLFDEPVEEAAADHDEDGDTEDFAPVDDIDIPMFGQTARTSTEVLNGEPLADAGETIIYKNPYAKEEVPAEATQKTVPMDTTQSVEEYMDEEYMDDDEYEDEDEETGSTEKLIAVLLVLLALLILAFGYIWFMRPELLHRGSNTKPAVVSVEPSASSAEPSSAVESTSSEGSAAPEGSTAEPSGNETVNITNTIDLTKPLSAAEASLLTGDPVAVGDVAGEVIGYANVDVDTLLVFADHSTSSKALGHARPGAHYEVDEIYEDGEYTWYEIAEGMWIPDSNGQWITYEKN